MTKVTSSNYVSLVLRSESVDFDKIGKKLALNSNKRLLHAAMGICTEAGELQDMIKRFFFYDKKFDTVNVVEELGDLLWYIGLACDVLGVSLEDVMTKNIAKLKARYPEKFDETKAVERNLDAERETLED